MKVKVSSAPLASIRAQAVILPVFEDSEAPGKVPELDRQTAELVRRSRLTGKTGELTRVGAVADDDGFDVTLLVGLGARAALTLDRLRAATSAAVSELQRFDVVVTTLNQLDVCGQGGIPEAVAVAEGALLGSYLVPGGQSSHRMAELILAVDESAPLADIEREITSAAVTCSAVAWGRELVDRPSADLGPADLADEARQMAQQFGLDVRVQDAEQLRAGGFGGLLAVGAGSSRPPCLIEVRHRADSGPLVGLAGKGITFDSGGLLLKTKPAMADMRSDMAGAATMLATIRAAAQLDCPIGVIAVVPAAENMPSGNAYRPGDIIRHRGGLTSEVIDTDAEGRVVLADAIAYLAEQTPDVIVDAATLTYDVIRALGDQIAGVLGNSPEVVQALIASGAAVGEPLWELPLWQGYRRNIESPVADLRNDGGPYADAIHAALFLAEFAKGTPWAHLDIAGTAYVEESSRSGAPTATGTRAPGATGATGTGVRTLVHWLMQQRVH